MILRSDHIPVRDPRCPPLHPGEILHRLYVEDGTISLTAFARMLGVSKQRLQPVLAGKSAMSVDMAVRVGFVLGNGPEIWLQLQNAFDIWQAERDFDSTCLQPISGMAP